MQLSSISLAITRIGSAFSPAMLFGSGEQGVWYDPSDFSTLFQDSAGTTPVTAVEQPVGKILDKSGRGNHATQATSASRPLLSARVNLLTYSEDFTDAAWLKSNVTVTSNVEISPIGTSTAALLTTTDVGHALREVGTVVTPNTAYKMTFYVKRGSMSELKYDVYNRSAGSFIIAPTSYYSQTSSVWARVSLDFTTPAGCTSIDARPLADSGVTGTVYIWGAQLETGSTATRYQRINAATDYDTVGFPLKETFDGVDDNQATTTGGGASTSAMIVLGFKSTLAGAAQTLWSDRTGNTGLKLEKTAANVIAFSGGNGAAIVTATGDAIATGTNYVVTALYDGVNLSVQLNNATAVTTACVLSAGTAAITVGKDNGAATAFFKGDIYETIYVKDDVQTASQIVAAKQFVASKSGVTL